MGAAPRQHMCAHRALVKLLMCHLPAGQVHTVGAQRTDFLLRHSIGTPGDDYGHLLHTLNYGLAAVLPQKHARRRCQLINRKG